MATQDQAYFDNSLDDTKTILQEMFTDKNITLERKNVNDFYTSLDIPINNLTMKYFKLEYFKLKNFMKREVWQPYLAVWTYGDSKIYLQYIKQEESNTLLDLNEKMKHEEGELVIKMVKINNNEIVPIYLKINKINNG